MQLPTQAQFVADCLSKYRWEPIPSDQIWEAAHFPLPACSGEHDTVQLWSADHTVQGLLQSVDLDHKCFHYASNGKDLLNLQTYYPQYLELFQQLKSRFNSRQGKKAAELKLGVHARSAEQMTADGKKGGKKTVELKLGFHAAGIASAAGKKAVELKVGIHGRSAEQMTADGKKAAAINKANGTSFYDPKIQSAGGKIGSATTNSQKWQCLVTGYISNPGGLSTYQKARGISTCSRIKLAGAQLVTGQTAI